LKAANEGSLQRCQLALDTGMYVWKLSAVYINLALGCDFTELNGTDLYGYLICFCSEENFPLLYEVIFICTLVTIPPTLTPAHIYIIHAYKTYLLLWFNPGQHLMGYNHHHKIRFEIYHKTVK
jgi:hypothetical protein